MKKAAVSSQVWQSSFQILMAGMLCVLLVEQPLIAEGMPTRRTSKTVSASQLQGEQRVLHALNRLTFGPRPGDVEAIQAVGLQRWFEQQLNPSSIPDTALDQRLEMFPAMKLQQAELMDRYPNPQLLRQMIRTNEPLPSDPIKHAIYADQIAFYKMAQAKRAATEATADAAMTGNTTSGEMAGSGATATNVKAKRGVDLPGDGAAMAKKQDEESMTMEGGKSALPGDGVDPEIASMATHEDQFYSGLEAVKIINLPPDQRVSRILAMQPRELIDFRKSLSQAELAAMVNDMSPIQRETIGALQSSPRLIGAELLQSRLLRDIYSDRQLEAVMTDFWLNHFNVYVKKNQNEPYLLPSYERDVVRPHALGKFEDLLVATAKSPAMLMYLDNWQSIGPDLVAAKGGKRFADFAKNAQVKQALKDRGLNENYARELMELHTLGVQCEVSADRPVSDLPKACGQGYTQKDVTQVAEVLTGWTIDRPYRGGEYNFEQRWHEPGSKTVLGTAIREDGEREGLQVLHLLATSPATAQFISNKLAVRFVSDTPPQSLVGRMAQSFIASDGDIKTVLRTMFNAPEFWAPEVYRAKVKTPLEFVVSVARASNADVVNAVPLVQALNRLGMPLYGMQTPNGYSWMAEPWVSTSALVSRMNFALVLSGNRLAGTRTDWTQALAGTQTNGIGLMKAASLSSTNGPDEMAMLKEKKLERLLMGQPVSARTRETVLQQFQDTAAQQQAEKDFPIKATDPEMLAGALPGGSMAYQEDRPRVAPFDQQAAIMAGLLLGSPEFQRR
ncbi:MAG: hypothetical protein JWM43_3684 [Acidobacteriaceae bacterium]|nr:hypothetical protein [Acidobacteriaceae bacterium]